MTTNRKHFNEELMDLNEKVITMGQLVLDNYNKMVEAVKNQDVELAELVREVDKTINELEVSINVDGYLLIAKQCPVASDLRRIITALKISNDLERIGDYADNIAKYVTKTKNDNEQFLKSITKLSDIFLPMLVGILKAFAEEDVKLALEINDQDEVLDKEYNKAVKQFIKIAKASTDEEVEEAMRAILVLKQIERAGDHVTNIAESIVYLVKGKRVELN